MSARSLIILSVIVALLAAAAFWMHRPHAARAALSVVHGSR